MTMQVKRGIQRKLSHVPESVKEHFAAQSKICTLNLGHPDAVAQYSGVYRFPVEASDLNESLVADLKSAGFRIDPTDQTIDRGDCKLYAVDKQMQDDLDTEAELAWHQQRVGANEGIADTITDNLPPEVRENVRVSQKDGAHVTDHVIHGGRR